MIATHAPVIVPSRIASRTSSSVTAQRLPRQPGVPRTPTPPGTPPAAGTAAAGLALARSSSTTTRGDDDDEQQDDEQHLVSSRGKVGEAYPTSSPASCSLLGGRTLLAASRVRSQRTSAGPCVLSCRVRVPSSLTWHADRERVRPLTRPLWDGLRSQPPSRGGPGASQSCPSCWQQTLLGRGRPVKRQSREPRRYPLVRCTRSDCTSYRMVCGF